MKKPDRPVPRLPPPSLPRLSLPPPLPPDSIFSCSPGPMTLISSFMSRFATSDNCSFSQLLAEAMASPPGYGGSGGAETLNSNKHSAGSESDAVKAPLLALPPGLSPTVLLNSPGLFSQENFGMSHQQALAQITAQASLITQNNTELASMSVPSSQNTRLESSDDGVSMQRSNLFCAPIKPKDDGYNWRKYGQKPVKGSEYPRSYYKCTYKNCPAKKKVEHTVDGHIFEIVYRGHHNHVLPQPGKRGGGSARVGHQLGLGAEPCVSDVSSDLISRALQEGQVKLLMGGDGGPPSDSEVKFEEDAKEDPHPKRMIIGSQEPEVVFPHDTMTEPKIVVQTRSEVDVLDDGYKWRKYGQKIVKGNPYPRSYYKCTAGGCKVRKHVERAATDPKAVITTYEGKHDHDLPAAHTYKHAGHTESKKPKFVES